MKKYTGRLERRDLEGGIWVLHAHGEQYTLVGEVPQRLAGQQVEVEGEVEEGFGFAMAGPSITVRAVRAR